MTAEEFVVQVLTPGISWCKTVLGWTVPFDVRSDVMLTAISGQEANWTDHIQGGNGPAHGLYQFERRGGVAGVLTDDATSRFAFAACHAAGVPANSVMVWGALATAAHDNLATAFARLLLWSDEAPLPAVGDEEAAWQYYYHLWRPGKPSRERWARVYPQAMAAVKGHTP